MQPLKHALSDRYAPLTMYTFVLSLPPGWLRSMNGISCILQGEFLDPVVIGDFFLGGPEPWDYEDVLKSIDSTELTRYISDSNLLYFTFKVYPPCLHRTADQPWCLHCSSILKDSDAMRTFGASRINKLHKISSDGTPDVEGTNKRAFNFALQNTFGPEDSKKLYLKVNLRPNQDAHANAPLPVLK